MTPEQIDNVREFHFAAVCAKIEGPRGGVTYAVEKWRRNGATQHWKRDPERFVIPIKYGLREYAYLTPDNVAEFHAAEDCPIEELR